MRTDAAKDAGFCYASTCRHQSIVNYLGAPLCWKHWEQLCEAMDTPAEDALRRKYGLPPRTTPTTEAVANVSPS